MSSSPTPPAVALYVAQIEQQCELLEPQAKLEFVEKEIRETCDDLESHYLRLDALVELVETKKLYRLRYTSDRAWIRSLDPTVRDAIEHSRCHRGMCTDLAMKINKSWDIWPWQLVGQQHQPRCWSKGILEALYKLSREGCGKSEAETLLAQARVDRAGRDYSDRRLGVTREDILTKADVTTALKNYQQLTVDRPSKKRKGPRTGQSTKLKIRKTTPVEVPSDNDATSPEIEIGRNHGKSLTNDESHDESPMAPLSPSSRSPCPAEGRASSSNLLSLEQLGHAEEDLVFEENLVSKASDSDERPISSTPEARYITGDDGNSENGSIHKDNVTDGKAQGSREKHSLFVHAHNRVIPNNDLSGAVGTLGDGQWVSSTAVELTLNKLRCAGIRTFDPSFLAGDGSTYNLKRIGDEKLWILPLLLHGDHWTLVTIEIDSGTVGFWNSLENEATESEARRIINLFEQFVLTSEAVVYPSASDKIALRNKKWDFNVQKCPQQENLDDCGIYVIMFAIYRSAGLTLPESIDVGLWRRLLRQLLQIGPVVVDASNDQPPGIVPAFKASVNDTPFTSSKMTAEEIPFPQATTLLQDPLNCFKRLDEQLSSNLAYARKQARLSVDTLQCLEQIQKQVAAFHHQNVQEQREMLEAIRIHQAMISMYSRLGASRSGNLDVLLDAELRDCEKRCEWKQKEVARLSETVESWELAVQTCGAVSSNRRGLVDIRTEAMRNFLNELRSWSERQRALIKDVEALEIEITATIKL